MELENLTNLPNFKKKEFFWWQRTSFNDKGLFPNITRKNKFVESLGKRARARIEKRGVLQFSDTTTRKVGMCSENLCKNSVCCLNENFY